MRPTLYPVLCIAVVAIVGPASAIDFHWTDGDPSNNFHAPLNWSPGSTSTSWPDGTNDAAIFDLASTYNVDFDNSHANERFEVRTGNPSLFLITDSTPHIYSLHTTTEAAAIVSSFPGALFAPQLTINGINNATLGQSTVSTFQVLQIAVGGSNTAGTLNLNNVTWASTAASFVGLNGNGALNLDGNAIMTSHSSVLGFTNLSVGTANISGDWNNTTADLVVGKRGTGTLNVNGHARTSTGHISIAEEAGSMGTIALHTDGRLSSAGSLYVGGGPSGPGGNGTFVSTGFILGEKITVGDDMIIYGNGTVDLEVGDQIYVENDTVIHPGGSLTLGRGDFFTETLTGSANSVTWTDGQYFVQDEVSIDANAPLGGNVSVSSFFNQTLTTNLLKVGPTAGGTLALSGEAGAGLVEIGSLIPGTDPATVTLGNTAAELNTVAIDVRGTTNATLNVRGGGAVTHLFSSRFAEFPGTNATVNVANPMSLWDGGGALYVGGNLNTPGGTAIVNVTDFATMRINDFLKLWPGATMTVDNAMLTIDNLEVDGSLTLQNDAVLNTNAATDVDVSGSLSIGDNIAFDIDELTITEGGHVTFGNQFVTVDALGTGNIDRLFLRGGTLTTGPPIEFLSSTFQGYGTLDGVVIANKSVFATGDLTMGRADVVNAVRISEESAFTVGAHHVTLLTKGFWDMHRSTRIMGGTLTARNGVSIRSGLFLSAIGAVDGRMFVHGGATIEADGGDLTLGDPASLAGFYSDGELVTHEHTVTLLDANEAVLGTLTTLGLASGGNPGTLSAPNGSLLEPGKNVTGYGTINGDFINQGYVEGVGPDSGNSIEFTGDVSGIGRFAGDIVFSGGFNPGNSPGQVEVDGNLIMSQSARLEIELAGTIAGQEHDRVNVANALTLDGELNLELINRYDPAPFDTFTIATFDTLIGDFERINGQSLDSGLLLIPVITEHTYDLVTAIPADFDLNGQVDVADLSVWATGFGNTDSIFQDGDADLNGQVDVADLSIWATRFGATAADFLPLLSPPVLSALNSATAIPEPSGLVLMGLGLLGAATRRRTRAA